MVRARANVRVGDMIIFVVNDRVSKKVYVL